ncbi:hypothetical protein GOP47_0022653 [Adiantum capillus-veneris]|uniref:Uncharacterized protein n=1 Tax=Adiantum capillus-veneris TaxID=13818 RepID=A0A9D4U7R5_ADICA|nr:hypothetical protein GOP47_0022653 [Adiantum capillus-veneris]
MAGGKLWMLGMWVVGVLAITENVSGRRQQGGVIPPWLDSFGAPRVQVPSTLATSWFTVTIVDPDAPSPAEPTRANVLHWIVSNIAPAQHSNQDIWDSGVESFPYRGPSPPNGTHRYYALVFEQSGEIQIEPIQNRTNFSVREFTRKYNLYYPIGGTFFRVSANM